jgi:hypothetical protein
VSPPRAEGSREPSKKNAGRNRPAQSSQHPSQVCRQPAVTGAGQAEFAAYFGDESAPNDAGEHDLGQQPAQMGRPESANHGSTKNKSKSFQASRRAGRAVRKREQQGAGRTRRSVGSHGSVPASLIIAITRLSSRGVGGFRLGQRMAATNRCLAGSNKSRTRVNVNKKRGALPVIQNGSRW